MSAGLTDRAKSASAILSSWFGDGGEPVDRELSEARAAVCATCPKNQHPKWWERSLTGGAAIIREWLSVRRDNKISTSVDDKLGICAVCGCCIMLKVHVPMKNIQRPDGMPKPEFPPHCWMTTENQK